MSRAGDWMCRACQHMNFKKRDSCQRCGMSKYGYNTSTSTNMSSGSSSSSLLAGDWYCQSRECGAHNYASRNCCYRCGSHKGGVSNPTLDSSDMMISDSSLPGWKTGDWICARPGCGVHNYACRIECFKCKTPRDYEGEGQC